MTGGRRPGSGRKPKPTALRILQGNPGHRPLPKNEPDVPPVAKLPRPPRYLNDEARREWRRMGSRLLKIGLVTEIDLPVFSVYCAAYARHAQAERELAGEGLVIETERGKPIQNPKLVVANRASELLLKAAVEFGMSPSSRTRVAIALPTEADPFDEFLKGHGRMG